MLQEVPQRVPLALVGSDPCLLGLGLMAVRADWPLAGLAGDDHARALEASLLLGCPAYPEVREPVGGAGLILLDGAVLDGAVSPTLEEVRAALRPGSVVGHLGPEGPEVLTGVALPLALHLIGGLPRAGAVSLLGATVALEGPEQATGRGADLVRALGGTPRLLGRRDCLLALAAVELARRQSWQKAWSLWPGAASGLPAEPPPVLPWQVARIWPWEGAGPTPCEAPLAVLARLVRGFDPQAAQFLEEEETEP